MKLVKACIALAAFAAIFVVPSVASASPELTHPTGSTVPVGTKIIATNVEHSGTSKITKMTTSIGNIECSTATMTGEVTSNTGTHIAGDITTVEFKGTPGEPNSAHCFGGFGGNTTVTPSHTTNPEHNGVQSLPWCITANELNDKFTVRGGKCSEKERALTFQLHTVTAGTCSYEKASVTGTYTTHPADAILTITGQEFTKVTGGAFCAASGKLDMAFTMTTDNNGVSGEPLYIS